MKHLAILISLIFLQGAVGAEPPDQGALEPPAALVVSRAELAGTFLLQVSYERSRSEHFMTSRSRIVTFRQRDGAALEMLELRESGGPPGRVLAVIPILSRSGDRLMLDINAGFDRIYREEDRTGEDYYGRVDRQDYSYFRLHDRKLIGSNGHGSTLVLTQRAVDQDRQSLTVHYYLRPYAPNPDFVPFDLRDLDHFGFYQAYPRASGDRTVLYATKFDIRRPITFALSSAIPVAYRDAVRDGVLYWNRAFGFPLVQAIDAPEDAAAPNVAYNIIQWNPADARASTSHIQADPLTGEILHAHIFIIPWRYTDTTFDHADYVRWLVAHEVGHALGLRHNFAPGPVTTVMNYFSPEESARIGREVVAGTGGALEYDRQVIRGVYLAQPLDIETLPAFCTDNQPGCRPFGQGRRAVGAAAGTHVDTDPTSAPIATSSPPRQ